jgi:hypothetical protein
MPVRDLHGMPTRHSGCDWSDIFFIFANAYGNDKLTPHESFGELILGLQKWLF